jgi:hypothetical protein
MGGEFEVFVGGELVVVDMKVEEEIVMQVWVDLILMVTEIRGFCGAGGSMQKPLLKKNWMTRLLVRTKNPVSMWMTALVQTLELKGGLLWSITTPLLRTMTVILLFL